MLREKLKNLDLKITELAEYMQVSRPTMYKFIECYDSHDFSQINPKVLKLFNYIDEHDLIGKRNVVNFILTQLSDVTADEDEGEADFHLDLMSFLLLPLNYWQNPWAQNCKCLL